MELPFTLNSSLMKSTKLILLLLILLCSCSFEKDERINEINEILATLHSEKSFNGNVLIAEKGKIIYEKSFGLANFETGHKLNPESIFNIASISKTFTGISILILEEKGLLNLKDNIKMYFPDFSYHHITIENLLTHTSGLYRIQSKLIRERIDQKGLTNSDLFDVYKNLRPAQYFESGTGYKYANTNYILLALIIEKVSKLPYHVFIQKNIFEKAGMKNTFLKKSRVPKRLQNNIVSYYRKPKWLSDTLINVDSIKEDKEEKLTFINNYGESAIHTTAIDLLKYHTKLQNGDIISPTALSKMYKPYKLNSGETYVVNPKSNYPSLSGLSWRIAKDDRSGQTVFHAGGIRGGRSFLIRNITKDKVVIMLTNNDLTDRHTFTFPMRILSGLPYQVDKKSLPKWFSLEYSKNGIKSALEIYRSHENDENFEPFIDWDFEEIGTELIEKKAFNAAVEVYKLYAEKYPHDEFSWSLLGDAYYALNNNKEALQNFKKSLNLNPENKHVINMIQQLKD